MGAEELKRGEGDEGHRCKGRFTQRKNTFHLIEGLRGGDKDSPAFLCGFVTEPAAVYVTPEDSVEGLIIGVSSVDRRRTSLPLRGLLVDHRLDNAPLGPG